jgi:hypothetical protein
MKKKNTLFSPASVFMIRFPLLPIEEFFRLAEKRCDAEALLSYYQANASFREAIAVASPSLDQAIRNMKSKKGKEREQVGSSLLKYLLRMSTRSTPFGLFSAVAQGKWGQHTAVSVNQEAVKKRSRPDMEWLMNVIDAVCHSSCRKSIRLKTNPGLFFNEQRIVLNHLAAKEDDQKQKRISINASPLVAALLDYAGQSQNGSRDTGRNIKETSSGEHTSLLKRKSNIPGCPALSLRKGAPGAMAQPVWRGVYILQEKRSNQTL